MSESSSVPWYGLVMTLASTLFVAGAIVAISRLCEWITELRDDARHHFLGRRWHPHPVDLLLLPLWIVLELLCLGGALLVGWMVYRTASNFRDWWHDGERD